MLESLNIQKLNLNSHAFTLLKNEGILNLAQLCACDERILLNINSLGLGTLDHIVSMLEAYLNRELKNTVVEIEHVRDATINPNFTKDPIVEGIIFHAKILDIPIEAININELRLNHRAIIGLSKANIKTIAQLCRATPEDLLHIRSIGVGTLVNIRNALEDYLSTLITQPHHQSFIDDMKRRQVSITESFSLLFNQEIVEISELIKELKTPFDDTKISNSIQLPHKIKQAFYKLENLEVKNIADMKVSVERLNPNEVSLQLLTSLKTWLTEVVKYHNIDEEVQTMSLNLDNREYQILQQRYSLVNPCTLEELGHKFNITRERVRQIQEKAAKKVIYQAARLPLFYSFAAVQLLKRMSDDATYLEWQKIVHEAGYVKEDVSLVKLLAIIQATKLENLCIPQERINSLRTNISKPTKISKQFLYNSKIILPTAKKIIRNTGAVRAISLANDNISISEIETILNFNQMKNVGRGWWTANQEKSIAKSLAIKVISYCGPIAPNHLRLALQKYCSRGRFSTPPTDVLLNVLLATNEFKLEDGLLNFTQSPSIIPRLTVPEEIFLKVVGTEGPVVNFETIHRRILENGYSSASVTSVLQFSPIVQRVRFSLYTRLGELYNERDIDKATSDISRIKSQYSYRLRTDGVVVFEFNAGSWFIYSGVVAAGPVKRLKGDWNLVSNEGIIGKIMIDSLFIRAPLSEIMKLNVNVGDRIRIEFNTWTRESKMCKLEGNEKNE